LKAEIEALAFAFAPKNKPTVIETGCGDSIPTSRRWKSGIRVFFVAWKASLSVL
jgi:hypothetical protein